jgi:hypothetical protein
VLLFDSGNLGDISSTGCKYLSFMDSKYVVGKVLTYLVEAGTCDDIAEQLEVTELGLTGRRLELHLVLERLSMSSIT